MKYLTAHRANEKACCRKVLVIIALLMLWMAEDFSDPLPTGQVGREI